MSRSSEAVELYRSGLRIREISQSLGIAAPTIYCAIHRAGLPLAIRNRQPFSPRPYFVSVDPAWASEFRGFFYGQGCAMIERCYRSGKPIFRPRLAVRLRDDDLPVLLDIQSHLGGVLNHHPARTARGYTSNPSATWYIHGWEPARVVIEEILLPGLLPAHKAVPLRRIIDFIKARYQMPLMLGEENRRVLDHHYALVKEANSYPSSG